MTVRPAAMAVGQDELWERELFDRLIEQVFVGAHDRHGSVDPLKTAGQRVGELSSGFPLPPIPIVRRRQGSDLLWDDLRPSRPSRVRLLLKFHRPKIAGWSHQRDLFGQRLPSPDSTIVA